MADHLGHVHLKVRDLDRSVSFYRDVFGLDETERHATIAFLSFGDHHHDVALQARGPEADPPGRGVGLYHAAFEVDTRERLRAVHGRLAERDVSVNPVDHGISLALYFDDPDGNGLEAYLDTRAEFDREAWHGRSEPFDPTEL